MTRVMPIPRTAPVSYTHLIRMCTGELSPDIIQQGLVKRALDHLSEKDLELNYSNPYGSPGLRTAIQSYLKGKGIEVPISNIPVSYTHLVKR